MRRDLHLSRGEWPFGERMGSSRDCIVAELQVSEVSQRVATIRGLVRIYASEQCPRQDSNLRSRLRRPLVPCVPTCGSRKQTSSLVHAWSADSGNPSTQI